MFIGFDWKIWAAIVAVLVGLVLLTLYDQRQMQIAIDKGCRLSYTELTPPAPSTEVSIDGKVVVVMRSRVKETWRCPDESTFSRLR